MKLVKKCNESSEESIITIEYREWTSELEELVAFLERKHAYIVGYGENKEVYQVKLDSILYFEAVGELVFAYTKKNVYEIKQRLYQVEEQVMTNKILRASKSILLNINRIEKLRPALNGRLYAMMSNGEEILISRNYARNITTTIKEG